MNKKGFMFVETIVTLSILIVLLVTLYNTFTNLLNKEKIGAEYEKKSDRYALFYIKEALMDSQYIETYKDKYVYLNGSPLGLESAGSGDGIDANVAILSCNSNASITVAQNSYSYARCTKNNQQVPCKVITPSREFREYVNQLPRNNCQSGAKYIIAGEFRNYHNADASYGFSSTTYSNYSYAYIFYPNVKAADDE